MRLVLACLLPVLLATVLSGCTDRDVVVRHQPVVETTPGTAVVTAPVAR